MRERVCVYVSAWMRADVCTCVCEVPQYMPLVIRYITETSIYTSCIVIKYSSAPYNIFLTQQLFVNRAIAKLIRSVVIATSCEGAVQYLENIMKPIVYKVY